MADSIKFTIGGQLGASYKSALSAAKVEALKANAEMNALIAAQSAKRTLVPRAGAAAVMMANLRNAYNPSFMQREGFFKQMADDAKAAEGHLPGLNQVLRETLVVFREIGRGNWARIPGSISLIVQGLRQMRASLGIFGTIFTMTGAAIGAVLIGAGLFAWHIHNITKQAQELAAMLDPLNKKFTEQAAAMRDAAKEHREFLDWLKKVGSETETLEQKTQKLIKSLHEHSRAQIELARARGANRMAIEAMEEAQLREELRITTLAKLEAGRMKEQAEFDAKSAEVKYNAGMGKAADNQVVEHAAKNASDILNAAMDAMKSKTITSGGQITGGSSLSGFTRTPVETRPANENDMLSFKVNDQSISMSVADAKNNFNLLSGDAAKLADAQQHLKDVFESSKSTLQERETAVRDLSGAEKELQDQLDIKTTTGQAIAAAGGKESISATDWEKNGGSYGRGMSMLDIGKQQLEKLTKIEKNTSGGHGSNPRNGRGVHFG